jgi:hypothetical protein
MRSCADSASAQLSDRMLADRFEFIQEIGFGKQPRLRRNPELLLTVRLLGLQETGDRSGRLDLASRNTIRSTDDRTTSSRLSGLPSALSITWKR